MNANEGQLDLARIESADLADQVLFRQEVPSTNDWARESADPFFGQQALFLTGRQTAGRGRGDSQWISSEGSLTFSLLVPMPADHANRPMTPLAAGVGICREVQRHDARAWIKWPNDVLVSGRKLAGVLVESISRNQSAVIGCGVNVNNCVDHVPGAISLKAATSKSVDLTDMLIGLVRSIKGVLLQAHTDSNQLVDELGRLDWLKGKSVVCRQGSQTVVGVAQGIAHDGSLHLSTDQGVRQIYSGTVRQEEAKR